MLTERQIQYRTEFLKSSEWLDVRIEVMARDSGRCVICQREGLDNDCHHIYYPRRWKDTKPHHLVILCRECHKRIHRRMERLQDAFADVHEAREWFERIARNIRKSSPQPMRRELFDAIKPYIILATLQSERFQIGRTSITDGAHLGVEHMVCCVCSAPDISMYNIFFGGLPVRPHHLSPLCQPCLQTVGSLRSPYKWKNQAAVYREYRTLIKSLRANLHLKPKCAN